MSIFPLLLLCAACASDLDYAVSAQSAKRAAAFINERMQRAPLNHDGIPLRDYALRDVDYDGEFEVLEFESPLTDADELWPYELYPPTRWITAYAYREGHFEEATCQLSNLLAERRSFYAHWQLVLQGRLEGSTAADEARERSALHQVERYLERIASCPGE